MAQIRGKNPAFKTHSTIEVCKENRMVIEHDHK